MRQLVADISRAELGHLRRAAMIVSLSVLATLFLTGLIWFQWGPLQRLDDWGVNAAVAWTADHPEIQDPLNRIGGGSGKRNLWPLSALLAGVLLLSGHRYSGSLIALSILTTTVATGGVKRLLMRDRPEWYVPEDPLVTSSFPSGHVSLWAALVVALAFVLPAVRPRLRGIATWLLVAPLAAFLLVISAQRVLQGRHFPSDVLVGGLIGIGCALASWMVIEIVLSLRRSPRSTQ